MMTTFACETVRFGKIECSQEDVVTFVDGILGFDNLRAFVLIQHREGSPFRWLQSLEDGNLAFLVVDPGTYVADYAPLMPDSAATDLELLEDTPRLVYTIVTIPRGKPEEMTLNLAGPIVINGENRKAKQIVLEDQAFPIRHRVFDQGAEETAAA